MDKSVMRLLENIIEPFYGDISGLVKKAQSAYNAFTGDNKNF